MRLAFLIVLFKLTLAEAPSAAEHWVIWNIGQGQWVTHITPDYCRHYDAGGEFGSFKKIKKSLVAGCGRKKNQLVLSHWDMDHFLNIPSLAKAIPDLCWLYKPVFAANKITAKKITSLNLPGCAPAKLVFWQPPFARTTNDSSAVFSDSGILLPGDSPIPQEKIWVRQLQSAPLAKVLVLGHHGSRTSTGHELLSHLPALLFSVSSARYQRYRHPHPEVVRRLRDYRIPLLKTEDWGNLWLQ